MPPTVPGPTFRLARAPVPDARDWADYLARAAVAPDPDRAAHNAAADAMELAVCGPRAARGRGGIW